MATKSESERIWNTLSLAHNSDALFDLMQVPYKHRLHI